MDESEAASYIVLVVEDDPFMRMAAVNLVVDASCKVFEAASADEAIVLLDAHPEITVLFTDIDMPGSMNGIKLAEAAKARRPELNVIIASGHLTPGAELPAGAQFFPKPYSPAAVVSAIRSENHSTATAKKAPGPGGSERST